MTAKTLAERSASYRQRKAERVARMEAALAWAVAEIEGRTRYDPDYYNGKEQFNNALTEAKSALFGK